METAKGNLVRDNEDQAQSSCIDLRVQGESDQSIDDEERQRSLTMSLMEQMLESPSKDKLMAELIPHDDEEYQEISQDAKDIVKEQGNLEVHEILMITDTAQCMSFNKYVTPRHTRIANVA